MKRVICAILSVLMLVSVLSVGMMNVSAASTMTTSDGAIEMLKQFEGFHAYAYPDNGQYSIGYGTSCNPGDYPDGITEEKATELLQKALANCENSTNNLANKNGLTFTQAQFDALVLFAYNLGYGWYVGQESGTLYTAIVNGATGNDFIYAMTLWCKASNAIHTGLVNRRLAEANLYLNGEYSKNPPANYSYVLFDGNGGSVSASIQGYDASTPVAIKATATYSGYYFAGWYTAKEGGKKVTALDGTTKGITLYAHWQKNEPVATGTVTASSLYVRASASATADIVGGVTEGTKVEIYEIVTIGNSKWGRIDNGWISLAYVKLDEAAEETPETPEPTEPEATEPEATEPEDPDTVIATGTVTASGALSIRKGPGVGYGVVGYYAKGDKVEIYEMALTGSTTWGRTDKGWISLGFVKLDEVVTEPEETEPEETEPEETEPETTEPEVTEPETTEPETTEPETTEPETTEPEVTEPEATEPEEDEKTVASGTVTGTVYLRKTPGEKGSIIGSIAYNTAVQIYGLKVADGIVWAQVEGGWISLNYVKLNTALSATVNCGLNIRASAGTGGKQIGSYGAGDKVNIYETKTVSGSPWGRTDKGWINLKYVTLNGVNTTPVVPETPVTPGTPETPETPDTVIANGEVTASALFIRKGPGTGYGSVGFYAKGDKVEILEMAISGSTTWGRTAKGWISLTYVKLDSGSTVPETPGTTPETPETPSTPETPVTPVVPGAAIATGKITASTLFVRRTPGGAISGSLAKGTAVQIFELQSANGTVWARTEKGWVSMTYVQLDGHTAGTPIMSGQITASALNIRKSAGTGSTSVGTYYNGDKVDIYEIKAVNHDAWGRTAKGWINLDFVKLGAAGGTTESVTPETPSAPETPSTPETPVTPETPSAGTVLATGTITASALSLRNGASANAAIIGTVTQGTTVQIIELKVADGILWGRTSQGWLSMNYVKLNAALKGSVSATTLYIRTNAGFNSTVVDSYSAGDSVNIYETVTEGGLAWGRTDLGWVSLKYIKLG